MTPEGKVKAMVKAKLKELGAWQYWPVSNGMGVHGIPDCIGCYKGKFFAIETKAPGKRGHKDRGCSKLQVLQGMLIQQAEGVWVVVDGKEDLEDLCNLLTS